MIRNKKDWYPLLTVFLIVVLKMLVWYQIPVSHVYMIIPIIFGTFVLFMVKHNHLHRPFFEYSWQNRVLESVLNVLTSTNSIGFKIIHLINHHTEENKVSDWGNTRPFEETHAFVGLLSYAFLTPFRFLAGKNNWIKVNGIKTIKKQIAMETSILLLAYMLMMILNPWGTLVFIILPNLLCQVILVAFNFIQHGRCDPESTYNHSSNFTGKLLNTITFNNGYHTVHHMKPGSHWSEYPALHETIEHKIDSRLNINNLFIYLTNMALNKEVIIRDKTEPMLNQSGVKKNSDHDDV